MFYRRKSFWDRAEINAALVAACGAAVTPTLEQAHKVYSSAVVACCVLAMAASKHRSRTIDDREKAEKATAAAEAEAAWASRLEALEEQNRQLARKAARAVLRALWRRYFGRLPNPVQGQNRATLFRCEPCDGPTGMRLAIFAREGRFPDSPTTWEIDDNVPGRCRGVAGAIWARNNLETFVADVPWDKEGDAASQGRFAAALNATVEETQRLKVKSRAFIGMTVMVGDKRWGVLLLDSEDPSHIQRASKTYNDLVLRYSYIPSEVLKEVGQ